MPDKGKKPDDIPGDPYGHYKDDGWINWGDWFGTGSVAPSLREFQPFKKARAFIRRLGLRNQEEWKGYCKGTLPGKGRKPDDIPVAPNVSYKDEGWASWGDWLGTGTVANQLRKFRPFRKARAFVRSLDLRSRQEWQSYCKGEMRGKGNNPDDIPTNPWNVYKNDGWTSLGDWLGTGRVAPQLQARRTGSTSVRQGQHNGET